MHFTHRLIIPAALAALLLSACGGSSSAEAPFLALTTGQEAAVVIGQADFTSGSCNRGGSAAADTICQPWGSPAVVGDRLLLPEYGNNRVLAFDAIPSANGASASYALGQADLVSTGTALTAGGLATPEAVSGADGKLAVVDTSHGRILIWNSVPTASGTAADVVVGRPSMTTSSDGACTASTFGGYLEGGMLVSGKLIAADSSNSRVLIWNSVPTTDGQAADLVLGQTDFTSCDTNSGGTLSASTLSSPENVWSDGKRLLVADSNNNRVLVWNTFPTRNGQAADVVLGQADFSSYSSGVSATAFDWPIGVSSNGTQIAVADANNHRVLVWNAFPTANGTPADVVLGQQDFTTHAYGTTASTMSEPGGVLLRGDMLVVGEWNNNRYLIFR